MLRDQWQISEGSAMITIEPWSGTQTLSFEKEYRLIENGGRLEINA